MTSRIFTLLGLALLLAGCDKLTQDNFSKLEAGMSRSQVEKIIGDPTECASALGMTSCTWGDDDRFVSVQFAGDQVMMFSGKGLK